MANNEEVTCSKCDYTGTPMGVKIHMFRKHTKRGQIMAKAAGARMNNPESRKKSLATRKKKKAGEWVPSTDIPKKKPRKAWGSNRAKAGPIRDLQHAAIHQLKFCPNCACNLEAVGLAMRFAAAQG